MLKASLVKGLRGQSLDAAETERLRALLRRLRRTRRPFSLSAAELEQIVHWKLRGQYARVRGRSAVPSDAVARVATRAAFDFKDRDAALEARVRVGLLTAIPGVGVPIASAVLALVDPQRYAVVDFRGWRQIFGEEKRAFTITDYERYLARIRTLAKRLGWPAQELDLAIWEYDRRNSTRRSNPALQRIGARGARAAR